MGNDTPKPIPKRDPQEEIQEAMMNMRMSAKQFMNGAKKAERAQKQDMEKAKNVIIVYLKSFKLNE